MPEYENLVLQIHECHRCFFRDESIQPIAPPFAAPPVPVMFVGENPSWDEDQDLPFDPRTVSGQALDQNYLEPLGMTRDQVWITDLFKCRYPKVIYRNKSRNEPRIKKEVIASCKDWLAQEIHLARPHVIVSLSDMQVYQRLREAFDLATPRTFEAAVGKLHPIKINGYRTILFPMIHPDISRPLGQGDNRKIRTRTKWSEIHFSIHLPELRRFLVENSIN